MARYNYCIDGYLLYGVNTFCTCPHAHVYKQPDVGDFIFYLQNNRPSSELLAALWNIYYRKFGKPLPVNVTTHMKFSRPNVGVKEGLLYSDPGRTKTSRSSSFSKISGEGYRVSIVWPEDKSTSPRSYL